MRVGVDLVDDRADDRDTPRRAKRARLSTISSIGRPTPASLTITAEAPSRAATSALERPMTEPTPACPVPSMSSACAVAGRPSVRLADAEARGPRRPRPMNDLVKPRGMWTGLITSSGSPDAEDRAHQDGVFVGRRAVHDGVALADRLHEPGREPSIEHRREQSEGEGRLATVHAGGCQIDLSHAPQGTAPACRLASSRACRRLRPGWRPGRLEPTLPAA